LKKVVKKISQQIEVRTIESLRDKFHPLAEMNPYQSEEEFNALMRDIELNGQRQPILLYKGKIVDGRHRWLALEALGEEHIKCVLLPNNMTLDEVKGVVFSMENRRHQDKTCRAIRAYREWKETGESQSDIAAKHGVTRYDISYCKTIDEYSKDMTSYLFEGNSYKLNDNKTTRNLKRIVNDLKSKYKENRNYVTPDEEKVLNTYSYFKKLSPALQGMFIEKLKSEGYAL
jgi:ribosomal protein L20A (L18A)